MIATFPIGSSAVKIVSDSAKGTWEFGVAFHHGRGRLCNTYTRYYLRRHGDRSTDNVWTGWPSGAPDPMDASERRNVYDWIEQAPTRQRRWLERRIQQASQTTLAGEPAEGQEQ